MNMRKWLASLTAFIMLGLTLGITPAEAKPLPSYTPTNEATCGQSAELKQRVCFDKSAQRIYLYTIDSVTAGFTSSYSASGASACSPFRSTAGEFSSNGWVIPGRCGANDLYISSSGSSSNQITTLGSTAVRNLGNYAAYEFVFVN